jgi:hypothetical protein
MLPSCLLADAGLPAPCSAAERAFKAQSERLMGSAAEAGDLAFGGEVQVESQVRPHINLL